MTTSAEKHLRRLRKFSDLESAIASLEAEIKTQQAKDRKSRALRKERTPPAPGKPAEQRRAERRQTIGEIRAEVLKRAGEDCEFCGASLRVAGFELHHVLSGSNRKAEERVETCAGICLACHRAWHGPNPHAVLLNAKEWALRMFMADALREIERRLRRHTPSVPVKIEVR